jgi:hypothetical protein
MPFDTALRMQESAKLFDADEIGWIAAEAAVAAARAGTNRLIDAHLGVPAVAKLAAHPRLRAHLSDPSLGLAGSVYLTRFDGTTDLPVHANAQNLVVFLGWRGTLAFAGGAALASEPGLVVTADAATFAAARPVGASLGAVLVLSFARGGATLAPVADDALWPQAWSAAG